MHETMRALVAAREAWEKAGQPGAEPQLAFFSPIRYMRPEVERAKLRDKPRR